MLNFFRCYIISIVVRHNIYGNGRQCIEDFRKGEIMGGYKRWRQYADLYVCLWQMYIVVEYCVVGNRDRWS